MSEILRPYQNTVIADVEREIAAGNRRILLVMPTGGGKTIVAGEIIQHYVRRYRPVLVLAHRLEIRVDGIGAERWMTEVDPSQGIIWRRSAADDTA